MSWRPVTQQATDSFFSDQKSSLQLYIDSHGQKELGPFVGLEYILEVHSTELGGNTSYKCLLCGVSLDQVNGMGQMVQHLTKLSHKLHYLEHFSGVKEHFLDQNISREAVDQVVQVIEEYYGRLPVKLVIGANTFLTNEKLITTSIRQEKHFQEDQMFMSLLNNKLSVERPRNLSEDYSRKRKKTRGDHSQSQERRKARRGSPPASVSPSSSPSPPPPRSRDPRRRREERKGKETIEEDSTTTVTIEEDDVIEIVEDTTCSRRGKEESAIQQVEKEENMFLDKPSLHPKYQAKWERFWHEKHKELSSQGIDISEVSLIPEWRTVWRRFIKAESKRKIAELTTQSAPGEEMRVLSLLHLLSRLSSNQELLPFSKRIANVKERALTMERERFGSSQEMVEEEECFTLMDQAIETLKLKLAEKKVTEQEVPAVRIAIQQTSLFLSQSSRERSDVLELESQAPAPSQESKLLRMSIAKTIQKELRARAKSVSELELNSIVEAEYQRVVHKIPRPSLQPSVQAPPPSSLSSTGELFSAYSSNSKEIDWSSVMKGVQNIQSKCSGHSTHPPVSQVQGPGGKDESLTDRELAALLRNFADLRQDEKNKLLACLAELETLDPRKCERMKKIIYQNR